MPKAEIVIALINISLLCRVVGCSYKEKRQPKWLSFALALQVGLEPTTP